jgi:tagatose-6-phosphate ketose/aldose isomerase
MGNYDTIKEINHQPELWLEVLELINAQNSALRNFLDDIFSSKEGEVIFIGAGSSFFIGEMVCGPFQQHSGLSSRAVSTTEIVTHPEMFINPKRKTLLVSFARSGNSPESMAAILNANLVSANLKHLIISCNKEGDISKMHLSNSYKIILPEKANDKSLAMTSSVTSMALAALLVSRLNELYIIKSQVELAAKYANRVISRGEQIFKTLIEQKIERAVFLGSASFVGVAREAHLKLQELTNGKLICKFDSFLGFRHGPKAVVNNKTLLFYFFSNDDYVKKYETDLVNSMRGESKAACSIGVSENKVDVEGLDLQITMAENNESLDESFLLLCSLVSAQLFAFYKSVSEGFNPDNPSVNGTIHRVVQGVTIYPFPRRKRPVKIRGLK